MALHLPDYPPLAQQAQLTGTALTSISIGAGGVVAQVRIEGVHPMLAGEIERAIRTSEFSSQCGGRVVRVRFTFALEGPASPYRGYSVVYRPPDHFVLVGRLAPLNP